jgi:hypothetical protein
LAEKVEWDTEISDTGVPWLQPRRGRGEVHKFFETLGALEFRKFQPKTLLESGDVVVALIEIDLLVKATGRTIQEDHEVHVWRFDAQGKVIQFDHKVDSYQHWLAFRGK